MKQCLLIPISLQYSAKNSDCSAAGRVNRLQSTSPHPEFLSFNAVCFYRHHSLISSSKCCYVRVECQKRSRCYIDRSSTSDLRQKRRGGANGDRNFRFFVPELRCPFIAGSNLCSRIPDVRATNSGEMYQRNSLKVTHFYVIYEHNSRICVTFLSSASSDYNDLPTENIIFKYKTSISRLQRQFHELAKSGFFTICVQCD